MTNKRHDDYYVVIGDNRYTDHNGNVFYIDEYGRFQKCEVNFSELKRQISRDSMDINQIFSQKRKKTTVNKKDNNNYDYFGLSKQELIEQNKILEKRVDLIATNTNGLQTEKPHCRPKCLVCIED